MLSINEMPEYRKDLAGVRVEFPPLDDRQTARHVELVPGMMKYLENETGAYDPADITFLRSAQVADAKYWAWEFYDPSGAHCYAMASERPRHGTSFAYDRADGLTPEQAMLADYHACY